MPIYTLEAGRVIARDGEPLIFLGTHPPSAATPLEAIRRADELAHRIVALLNSDGLTLDRPEQRLLGTALRKLRSFSRNEIRRALAKGDAERVELHTTRVQRVETLLQRIPSDD